MLFFMFSSFHTDSLLCVSGCRYLFVKVLQIRKKLLTNIYG